MLARTALAGGSFALGQSLADCAMAAAEMEAADGGASTGTLDGLLPPPSPDDVRGSVREYFAEPEPEPEQPLLSVLQPRKSAISAAVRAACAQNPEMGMKQIYAAVCSTLGPALNPTTKEVRRALAAVRTKQSKRPAETVDGAEDGSFASGDPGVCKDHSSHRVRPASLGSGEGVRSFLARAWKLVEKHRNLLEMQVGDSHRPFSPYWRALFLLKGSHTHHTPTLPHYVGYHMSS